MADEELKCPVCGSTNIEVRKLNQAMDCQGVPRENNFVFRHCYSCQNVF